MPLLFVPMMCATLNKYIYFTSSIFNWESRSERLIIYNVYDFVKIW